MLFVFTIHYPLSTIHSTQFMSKEMLINVSEGEECRIALVENGRLEELYMERTSATSHVGNIYKGRVTNVEPSIQAAFIDFGLGRNGFLHISDLMPSYFGRAGSDVQETVGRKMARRDRPPIQRCLRRGDEIIVQIIKEGIGTKGPTLSSYISIPGKMLVMMPGMGKMGVSKKIEDEAERRRLRTILDSLKPPKGVAFIIRTAGVGKSKTEIERDLKYLTRVWEQIERLQKEPGPVELYTEGDLVARTVRDVFTSDVDRIVVDNKDVAKRVKDVIKISAPRTKNKVDVYEDPVPLFHEFGIERDIEMMYSRHVPLPSGGSLVIDSTEAIVAIDVNSGKNRESGDAETTAFRVDMEAADEICRQLKLRDLGGVIICDFIDLRFERHRRELEKRLDDNFKRDRAKTKVLRMSQFGIIEMTRQRMRPSLKRSVYFDCPHCKGAGLVKTPESMALDVMRKLAIAACDGKVVRIELGVSPDVANALLNKKRRALADLEDQCGKKIVIRSDISLGLDELRMSLFDIRDGLVVLDELGMTIAQPGHVTQLGKRAGGGGRNDRSNNRRDGQRDDRNRNNAGQRPGGGRPQVEEDDEDEDARFARITAEEAQEADQEPDDEVEPDLAEEPLPDRAQPRGRARPAPSQAVSDDEGYDDEPLNDGPVDYEESDEQGEPETEAGAPAEGQQQEETDENGVRRRRRRRRGRRGRGGSGGEGEQQGTNAPQQPQPNRDNRGDNRGENRGDNRDNRQQRDDRSNRSNRGDGRYDSPAASYNQGRRSDGSFENVTELETVDFGDESDEHPQPVSNESPRLRDRLKHERKQEIQKHRDNSGGNIRRDDRGPNRGNPPQNRGGQQQPNRGDNRGENRGDNRGGRQDNRGGQNQGDPRRQQPVRVPPPRPVDETPSDHEEFDDNLEPQDEINGPQSDQVNGDNVGAEGVDGDQPRKRRRRRGGRRHRRRRENQLMREQGLSPENTAPGALPLPSPNDGGSTIPSADYDEEEDYESAPSDRNFSADSEEGELDDELMEGEVLEVLDAPEAEAETEVEAEEPVVVEEVAPKKSRSRRKPKVADKDAAQDPASSTSKPSRVRRKTPAPAPLPVVKTGSTDKHLVASEEVDDVEVEVDAVDDVSDAEAPAPVSRRRGSSRRPSSYSDLDAIPDDYD